MSLWYVPILWHIYSRFFLSHAYDLVFFLSFSSSTLDIIIRDGWESRRSSCEKIYLRIVTLICCKILKLLSRSLLMCARRSTSSKSNLLKGFFFGYLKYTSHRYRTYIIFYFESVLTFGFILTYTDLLLKETMLVRVF